MSETQNLFAPPALPVAPLSTHSYIQPNMNYALRVWWAYYWPTAVASLTIDFLYKAVASTQPFDVLVAVALLAVYLIISIFIMRYVLGKTFRHFRLALVSRDLAAPQPLPVTISRALRVWWFFSWRVVLYSFLGMMLVIYPLGMFVGLFNPSPLVSASILNALRFLLTSGISLYVIYSDILDEDMGDFHITLLPRNPALAEIPFS
jgi:hypothetical protein